MFIVDADWFCTVTWSLFSGIWIRDIRYKSNLQLTQVNKILKTLESKKLIKAIKSVAVIYFYIV